MASASDIAVVRHNMGDTTEPYQIDEGVINSLVDGLGVDGASAVLWRRRAAELSALVDVSEGGASRKLSQGFTHAREMATMYDERSAASPETTNRPRVHRIQRPGPA